MYLSLSILFELNVIRSVKKYSQLCCVYAYVCVRVCVCACVRACVCVCARVRARVHACARLSGCARVNGVKSYFVGVDNDCFGIETSFRLSYTCSS